MIDAYEFYIDNEDYAGSTKSHLKNTLMLRLAVLFMSSTAGINDNYCELRQDDLLPNMFTMLSCLSCTRFSTSLILPAFSVQYLYVLRNLLQL